MMNVICYDFQIVNFSHMYMTIFEMFSFESHENYHENILPGQNLSITIELSPNIFRILFFKSPNMKHIAW
jgi:hypothetical protein